MHIPKCARALEAFWHQWFRSRVWLKMILIGPREKSALTSEMDMPYPLPWRLRIEHMFDIARRFDRPWISKIFETAFAPESPLSGSPGGTNGPATFASDRNILQPSKIWVNVSIIYPSPSQIVPIWKSGEGKYRLTNVLSHPRRAPTSSVSVLPRH
jgi:hypothetical protein